MLNLILQASVDVSETTLQPFHGGNVAVSGIVTVFFGLILIALLIALFNVVFRRSLRKKTKADIPGQSTGSGLKEEKGIIVYDDVENDVLAAIGATIELYKRLHMDDLQSKVNFRKGREQSGWKAGVNYGHRL